MKYWRNQKQKFYDNMALLIDCAHIAVSIIGIILCIIITLKLVLWFTETNDF
jgi:hypothetical protein